MLTLLTAFAALLAALPGASQAGEYVVKYCQPGLPLQDWQPYKTAPGTLAESCAAGTGGPVAIMDPNNYAGNSEVTWLLRWPPGIRPVYLRARANRTLNSGTGVAEGGVRPYGSCATSQEGNPCPSGQPTSVTVDQAVSPSSGDPGQRFSIGVSCFGSALDLCRDASGSVDVQQLEITWRDDTPPQGSADLSSATTGPIRGVQHIEYRATDSGGSGVRRVEARIDGRTVAVSPAQCQPPYSSMLACPSGAIGQLAIDTAGVDDGTHELSIVAVDVGDNDGVLARVPILTQNGDRIGPGSDPGLRGTPNGTYGADDARLRAWWPATKRAPSKNRKVRQRCKRSARYRRARPVACRGRAAKTTMRVSYSARKSNRIGGRLTTPTGEGIAGATLQIVATPAATGAQSTVIQTLSTDGGGRFAAAVPVASGSATYSVQWRARSRDTEPAATADVRRTVRAATSISIKPSPTAYRRQRLEITGKLRGANGTRRGTAILIQANAGSSWRAVTTVRARSSGRWTARYRVPSQLRGRYRFRAVVRPAAGYPYASGSSRQHRIRIR